MVRCRYQDGYLFTRGKKRKMWVARWRDGVIQPDGTVERILRSEVLGLVSEIPSRRDARILLQSRLASINSGQRWAQATMSFGAFVTEHFEPIALPTLKPATQEIYSFLLRKHLLPRFRDCRLCDITRAEVQPFLIGKLKNGYAWETTHHLRSLLSKVIGTAVDWNFLSDNRVRGTKMPERSLKRPHRFLSLDEVRRLLAASEEPVRTIVLVAVMTGLRIGEILALRWGRINLGAGLLRVEETCYKGTFGTPKTHASRREVPLTPAVVQALQERRVSSRDIADSALVFSTRQGTPLDAKNLRRRQLHPASQPAGLGLLDWHSLRPPYSFTREHSHSVPSVFTDTAIIKRCFSQKGLGSIREDQEDTAHRFNVSQPRGSTRRAARTSSRQFGAFGQRRHDRHLLANWPPHCRTRAARREACAVWKGFIAPLGRGPYSSIW
jgi:integrase